MTDSRGDSAFFKFIHLGGTIGYKQSKKENSGCLLLSLFIWQHSFSQTEILAMLLLLPPSEGQWKIIFSACVSAPAPRGGGEIYLPADGEGITYLPVDGGGGYLPSSQWWGNYFRLGAKVSTALQGRYLSPVQGRHPPVWGRYPPVWGKYPPPPVSSTVSTCYAASGMPLVFFLVSVIFAFPLRQDYYVLYIYDFYLSWYNIAHQ